MTEQLPVARFTPGTRTALARADVWLLLDRPLSDPFSLQMWSLVSEGRSVDDLLDGLLSPGMRAAPAFVLAEHRDSGIRILARGDFSVRGTSAGGPVSVAGHSICADVSLADVETLELCASAVTGDPVAPLVLGIVPADAVTIRFRTPRDEEAVALALDEARAPIDEADAATAPEFGAAAPTVETNHEVGPGVAAASDQSLAAVRGYERLFGDPTGAEAVGSAPIPSTPSVEVVAAKEGEAGAPGTLPDPASVENGAEPSGQGSDETTAGSPAGVVTPSSRSGIIEALPDFFGPLAGASTEPPAAAGARAPSFATPAAPTVNHQAEVPGEVGTPLTPRTVNRAQLHASLDVTGPTVWAAWCPVGHSSQAFGAVCRVCGRAIARQEPQEIPRPVLGQLLVPGAPAIPLDTDLVLGRDPHVPPGASAPVPRLVVLQDPRHEVSSQHASITLNFWDVCLTDLGSTNGTEIVTPDGRRQRLSQDVPVAILPKTRIILGEVLEMVFEASA